MTHDAPTTAPTPAGAPTEPRVLVIDSPDPCDYRDGREMTLADALSSYGNLIVHSAHRPNRRTDRGVSPYGDPDTARLHLALRNATAFVATLVVRDEDTAWVTAGSATPLAEWFAPVRPTLPADGEMVAYHIRLARHLHDRALPFFSVLPDGSRERFRRTSSNHGHQLVGFTDPWTNALDVTCEQFLQAPHLALGRIAVFDTEGGWEWPWERPVELVRVSVIPRPLGYDGPAVVAVPAPAVVP